MVLLRHQQWMRVSPLRRQTGLVVLNVGSSRLSHSALAARRHLAQWKIWSLDPQAESALLGPDVRSADYVGPLFGFFGNELAEVGGRASKHHSAKLGEPRLHNGVGEGRIDLIVEVVDDFGGRGLGEADAMPGTRLVT